MSRRAQILLALLLFSVPARAQRACLVGTWLNDSKHARVQIYEGKDGRFYGRVVWLHKPNMDDGKPKTDIRNPDPKLRNRSIMGLIILKGFTRGDDDTYTGGTVYDPKAGRLYSAKITCEDGGRALTIRGFVGISLIGKNTSWTRVN